jgi:hypothetical protein
LDGLLGLVRFLLNRLASFLGRFARSRSGITRCLGGCIARRCTGGLGRFAGRLGGLACRLSGFARLIHGFGSLVGCLIHLRTRALITAAATTSQQQQRSARQRIKLGSPHNCPLLGYSQRRI